MLAHTPSFSGSTARVASTMAKPQSKAKRMPMAIMMPNIVEKVPRSRTWNHGALTVTIATAP